MNGWCGDIWPLRALRANPALRALPCTALLGEAPGAWPAGTRVVKTNSAPDDAHTDGATAVVIGSVAVPEDVGRGFIYCVLWDSDPTLPVHLHSARLRKAP